ncbi:repeat containing protein [Candidatus Magnetoovum chiemensis]|nr:repeat containing protein [Candidatus Magnetoovum chiemensis]
MKAYVTYILLIIGLSIMPLKSYASTALDNQNTLKQAQELASKGNFGDAAELLKNSYDAIKNTKDVDYILETLIELSNAYQSLGKYDDAVNLIQNEALPIADKSTNDALKAKTFNQAGSVYLSSGNTEEAERQFNKALELSRKLANKELEASTLNNMGNLYSYQKLYDKAIEQYTQSAEIAHSIGDAELTAKALINASLVYIKQEKLANAKDNLVKAQTILSTLNDTRFKSFALINISQSLYNLCGKDNEGISECTKLSYNALAAAQKTAQNTNDSLALSYSLGYMGKLYENDKRYEEALTLTRQAAFEAQKTEANQALYLWQWQTGRLLNQIGDINGAALAYTQTINTLDSIREAVSKPCPLCVKGSFREDVEPIYYELSDIYLKKSETAKDEKEKQQYLFDARDTIELMKSAEVREYFNDACVDANQGKITKLDTISKTTSVVYAISFPERLEVLVTYPSGIKRYTINVSYDDYTNTVNNFRKMLEKRTTRQYRTYSEKLYKLLIEPIEADLKSYKIDTLVFVPDRALRTVPMSALYNGKEFLINKYAIATTLGLNLTDPKKVKQEGTDVLIAGLTEAVQNYSPLVSVPYEIEGIETIYKSAVLQDQTYIVPNVGQKLEAAPFSIVHIATHGEFSNDSGKSFLLTYDGKLTMDDLDKFIKTSKFRKDPLELLTLSACQTAAGDDRAALGLAGVSIKAGARSALATLWSVNDQATSSLILEFYKQLSAGSLSKAQALQKAQLSLINNRQYTHPYFWSAFLLIGNWL